MGEALPGAHRSHTNQPQGGGILYSVEDFEGVSTIYVDVDDTLLTVMGDRIIPRPTVVRLVKELKEKGKLLYCWSTGGEAYARKMATGLGIQDCFSSFLKKPEAMIDDEEVENWRNFTFVDSTNIR